MPRRLGPIFACGGMMLLIAIALTVGIVEMQTVSIVEMQATVEETSQDPAEC